MKNNHKKAKKQLHVIQREKLMRDDPEEWAVLLALLGFSARCIAHETGLLNAQSVYYYLSKRRPRVRISDYRNGVGKMAQFVISSSARLNVHNPVRVGWGPKLFLPPIEA
jgi:hypothetical protein